jgi:hypothetical protein
MESTRLTRSRLHDTLEPRPHLLRGDLRLMPHDIALAPPTLQIANLSHSFVDAIASSI